MGLLVGASAWARRAMKNCVRELRVAKKWSQGELADRVDASRQTINAIEAAKYDPSLPLAYKIAALFGVPVEDIFENEFRKDEHFSQNRSSRQPGRP
jgi:putative transcriptional regulator